MRMGLRVIEAARSEKPRGGCPPVTLPLRELEEPQTYVSTND